VTARAADTLRRMSGDAREEPAAAGPAGRSAPPATPTSLAPPAAPAPPAPPPRRFTRGRGLLEPTLARLRARRANRLIPPELRAGRILDVGCGSYPYFLSHTSFKEKLAVERQQPASAPEGIRWFELDLNTTPELPFPDGHLDVVTMLAVVEHLDPASLEVLFADIRRVLRPGGRLVVTTPASWSDGLLKLMARLRLVSAEEIDEHVFAYTQPLLGWYFGRAGFARDRVRFGYFEGGLNLWATADR
jgi:SAM-dependent methyltransferase